MCRCLAVLFALFVGEVLCASPCVSKWSPAVNETHPGGHSSNGGDHEKMTLGALSTFCPLGQVTNVRCLDEKGESFDPNRGFSGNCTLSGGLVCSKNGTRLCPDFAIEYYCNCPTTPVKNIAGVTPVMTNSGASVTPNNGATGNSGSKVTCPLVLLVVCVWLVSAQKTMVVF